MNMIAETNAPTSTRTNDDTIRILRAIALLLSTLERDDSGQSQRDLKRMANVLVRLSERARARVQTVPDQAPQLLSRITLGPRENAIARLLAEGKAYKDIAALLSMGLSSVGTRVKTVYLKLGVHSRLELQQRMLAAQLAASSHSEEKNADSDGAHEDSSVSH